MFKSISSRTSVRVIVLAVAVFAVVGFQVTRVVTAMQRDEILLRGKALAKSGAAAYAAVLQRGMATGALQWSDLFSRTYTEIHFPVKVEEPRYHSAFDWFTDQAGIQAIEDAITASDPMALYAIGNDLTGYIPTTLTAFSHPPTGNAASDAVNARSKRVFATPMHQAAAAWTGDEPLVQEYHRDTGHVAWDVAQPIWLRNPADGKLAHWGSFRVGIRQDKVTEVRDAAITYLGIGFAAFATLLACAMYVAVWLQLRPLRVLSVQAELVSKGETDDLITTSSSASEVVEMASAMRRLQKSLRAAMDRLPSEGARHPTQVTEVVR